MSRIKNLYPAFEHWQKVGNIWIFSDPHFDDSDCLSINPNWITPKEHIKRISSCIHPGDTLVCLGDVGNPKYMKWIKKKVRKILVKGNHDVGSSNYTDYFDEIYEGAVMIHSKIILSHEPVYLPFAINIHGHVHNGNYTEYVDGKLAGYNLASDVANWMPFSLNENVRLGILKEIPDMHRITIDNATEKKYRQNEREPIFDEFDEGMYCPTCDIFLGTRNRFNYCPNCGQKFKGDIYG